MNRRLLTALALIAVAALYAEPPRLELTLSDLDDIRLFEVEIGAQVMGLSLDLSF